MWSQALPYGAGLQCVWTENNPTWLSQNSYAIITVFGKTSTNITQKKGRTKKFLKLIRYEDTTVMLVVIDFP